MPSDGITWKLSGVKELEQKLRELPVNIQSKALKSAAAAGMKVIRDDARSRVHDAQHWEDGKRTTGGLRDAIRFSTKIEGGNAVSKLFVSIKKAWYGRLVEYGTLPHFIRPRGSAYRNRLIRTRVFGSNNKIENRFKVRTADSRSKALLVAGKWYAEKVDHPGAAPKPFMAPALGESADAAIAAVVKKLTDFLSKYRG
jgi:HK97 gp10 family phage protein